MREKISKKLICFKTLHSFQLIVLMIGKSIDWQLMRKFIIDNAFVPDLVHERQFLVLRLRLMIFSFGSLPSFFSTFDEWMDLESGESPLLEDPWLPEIPTKVGDPEIFSQQYQENWDEVFSNFYFGSHFQSIWHMSQPLAEETWLALMMLCMCS